MRKGKEMPRVSKEIVWTKAEALLWAEEKFGGRTAQQLTNLGSRATASRYYKRWTDDEVRIVAEWDTDPNTEETMEQVARRLGRTVSAVSGVRHTARFAYAHMAALGLKPVPKPRVRKESK